MRAQHLCIAYVHSRCSCGYTLNMLPCATVCAVRPLQAFSWYYAVFGGNGALPNGERGIGLCKALIVRWQEAFKEWEGAAAFKYNLQRFKDRPNEPLTVEECMNLLPESKRQWVHEMVTVPAPPAVVASAPIQWQNATKGFSVGVWAAQNQVSKSSNGGTTVQPRWDRN
jgi:hypothetical protein